MTPATKTTTIPFVLPTSGPDHTQLPESDGTFVKNLAEHPQSILLSNSIEPVLKRIHGDEPFAIGQDSGIYWRITEPPEQGAEAPDWFYVPGVKPDLDGRTLRSYVMWKEKISPLIALEFASGNGSEERDKTPLSISKKGKVTKPGKYWVYEKIIRIKYYGIYVIDTGELEVYKLIGDSYEQMKPNNRGHYPIEELEIELGLWRESYLCHSQALWLRWWDNTGKLLLTGDERAQKEAQARQQEAQARQQAEQKLQQEAQARQQAEQELQQEAQARQQEAQARQQAEQERQQAEQERQQAEQGRLKAEEKISEFQQNQRDVVFRSLNMGLTPEQIAAIQGLSVEQVMQILGANSDQ